ncbi:MAG: transcription termination factor NusA [Minisyncoccia bacterium]
MDLKTINNALDQIATEKGLNKQAVLEALEGAFAAAYKREYRKKGEVIKSKFDTQTGELKFWLVKTVVDKNDVVFDEKEIGENKILFNPDRHILLEEAQKTNPDIKVGDVIETELETHSDFGRIAAQVAKQAIIQNLREAEKRSIKQEFANKEGEIISGIIQRLEKGNVYVDLGRTAGIMFKNECVPGEHYRPGDRMRFYILAVQDEKGKPGIVLSRSHPQFIQRLLELEVPEIADGVVEVKKIAREPGNRTKVAVLSKMEGIDAVGSVIGQRGIRILAVTNELGNEKIDVVEWSDDPAKFIANAFSPAKIKEVQILPKREAKVFVADDQLSLAIGKGGQNARLVAKLTGWKLDIRSQSRPEEIQEGGITEAVNLDNEEEITLDNI